MGRPLQIDIDEAALRARLTPRDDVLVAESQPALSGSVDAGAGEGTLRVHPGPVSDL
ncbi:MAG: hypothetical protein M5U19_19755 [Microthrixaceae bacterium]|nr:hypothetical protein [Microthrixaceae bacterium]